MTLDTNTHRAQDIVRCHDCGSEYDRMRKPGHTGTCPTCPELVWAVWDSTIYDDPLAIAEPDAVERGIYERGFPSKEQAEAAIPRIQAHMAQLGEEIPTWQFVVAPDIAL
jgi:hypothetical protein